MAQRNYSTDDVISHVLTDEDSDMSSFEELNTLLLLKTAERNENLHLPRKHGRQFLELVPPS